jgi:hypothetical protein
LSLASFTRCELDFEADALNLATGALKLNQRIEFSSKNAQGALLTPGVALMVFTVTALVILASQRTKVFAAGSKVCSEIKDFATGSKARHLAENFVVYASVAVSGVSPSPRALQMKSKKDVRRNFSLEHPSMRLDACYPFITKRNAPTLDNILMPATLDGTPSGSWPSPVQPTSMSSSRHPGRKPQVDKLRHLELLASFHHGDTPSPPSPAVPEAKVTAKPKPKEVYRTRSYDEWEDSDWEDEPRASPVLSGLPMDGEDVGILPHRTLKLPGAMVRYKRPGSNGRSIFQSDWPIPKPE